MKEIHTNISKGKGTNIFLDIDYQSIIVKAWVIYDLLQVTTYQYDFFLASEEEMSLFGQPSKSYLLEVNSLSQLPIISKSLTHKSYNQSNYIRVFFNTHDLHWYVASSTMYELNCQLLLYIGCLITGESLSFSV